MLNKIIYDTNQAVQNVTETINDISQGFTDARRAFRDRPADAGLRGGRIEDVGTRYGALAASGEKWAAKYIVGRGFKTTDTLPLSRQTMLKQHGVVGLGLRTVLNTLGALCRIAPENNVATRLADAAMAAVRLFVIGLPEATLVALAYIISAPLQMAYDSLCKGVNATGELIGRMHIARNKE